LQGVVEARLDALLDGPGAAASVGEGATVVLDAATGALRAMAGGRDYRQSSFNRAVSAHRQPGSAFKPFVWLAALEAGLQPDDMVLDAPIRVGRWQPANFERGYLGEITLEEALAQSVNTAAVRLEQTAGGPRAVAAVAHRLGIVEKLPDDASLALGTGEVGLLELARAYASFCNGGIAIVPTAIEGVSADGKAVALPRAAYSRVIDPEQTAMMARMLGAVVSSGTGRAAAIPSKSVLGKTGTTQDYRDAWFVGCVSGTVIGVWLGNDDNAPMRQVMGGGLPARLFRDIAVELR
jgi:penicillin-binding protein 1A